VRTNQHKVCYQGGQFIIPSTTCVTKQWVDKKFVISNLGSTFLTRDEYNNNTRMGMLERCPRVTTSSPIQINNTKSKWDYLLAGKTVK